MAELRLASYNIKSGQHVANGLDALAATLREIGPDVVSLQEVDRGTVRSGQEDQTAELADRLGFAHHAFAAATEWAGGGEYGVALISRLPLEDIVITPLWVPDDDTTHPSLREPRTLLSATIRVDGVAARVFATHFGLGREQRVVQVREVAAAVDQARVTAHPIVLGDLNCPPDGREIAPLASRLKDAHAHVPRDLRGTFPTGGRASERSITDYILVASSMAVRDARVFHRALGSEASDHYALVASVALADAHAPEPPGGQGTSPFDRRI